MRVGSTSSKLVKRKKIRHPDAIGLGEASVHGKLALVYLPGIVDKVWGMTLKGESKKRNSKGDKLFTLTMKSVCALY